MPTPSPSIDTRPAPAPTDASPDWRHGAACRPVTPETFFPAAENGNSYDEQVTAAKAICRSCPVLEQCRSWSLLHLAYGVAGGLTGRERSTPRRQRRAHPRATATAHAAPAGEVAATAIRLCVAITAGEEDHRFGSGLLVDLVPASCWFTNVSSCIFFQKLHLGRRAVSSGRCAPVGQ